MGRPIILAPNGRPATRAAYDAVDNAKGKRRGLVTSVQMEDVILGTGQRSQLIGIAQDQRRNVALTQWMINCHLDYVSAFSFQGRTPDSGLNKALEALVAEWSLARNCSLSRRLNLAQVVRMIESHRVVDGDAGLIRTNSGRLQLVEGSRIGTPSLDIPPDALGENVYHGVEIDPLTMEHRRYAVCQRNRFGSLQFQAWVSAQYMDLVGYYYRADQVRGISPLSTALNTLADLYEALDYNLQKAKWHALLGMFITRQQGTPDTGAANLDDDTGEAVTGDTERYRLPIKGLLKIEGEPGDSVNMLESHTPSGEFQQYSQLMIQIALLALNIPLSFFDSRESSYSAARQDLMRYMRSVQKARADLVEMLDHVMEWKLSYWVQSGALKLPGRMTYAELNWEWIPDAVPWIDPLKEITSDIIALSAGLTSPQQAAAKYGNDAYEVLDQLAAYQRVVEASGARIQYQTAPAIAFNEPEKPNAAPAQ